jgi:hypothetical protein
MKLLQSFKIQKIIIWDDMAVASCQRFESGSYGDQKRTYGTMELEIELSDLPKYKVGQIIQAEFSD